MISHSKIFFLLLVLLLVSFSSLSAHVGLRYPTSGLTFAAGDTVQIEWIIEIDHGDCVWKLEFSNDGGTSWETIIDSLPKSQYTYDWIVPALATQQAQIRVTQENALYSYFTASSGNFSITTTTGVPVSSQRPGQFELLPAYPNPFNPTTTLSFTLPSAGYVSLQVFDINGRLQRTVLDKEMPAGTHAIQFNADRLASGMYFEVLHFGTRRALQKLLLVK